MQLPNHHLKILRQFERIQAAMQQADPNRIQRKLERLKIPIQALEHQQQQIERLQSTVSRFQSLSLSYQLLANSIKPLPDFGNIFNSIALESTSKYWTAINRSIQAANFIASLEYN